MAVILPNNFTLQGLIKAYQQQYILVGDDGSKTNYTGAELFAYLLEQSSNGVDLQPLIDQIETNKECIDDLKPDLETLESNYEALQLRVKELEPQSGDIVESLYRDGGYLYARSNSATFGNYGERSLVQLPTLSELGYDNTHKIEAQIDNTVRTSVGGGAIFKLVDIVAATDVAGSTHTHNHTNTYDKFVSPWFQVPEGLKVQLNIASTNTSFSYVQFGFGLNLRIVKL